MDTAIVCKKPGIIKTILLQLFSRLCPEWFPPRQELERLTKENKTLKGIISQTYDEARRALEGRSKRLLELHRELVVKEKLIATLSEVAVKDPLTGALNRRGANIALLRQVGITQRTLRGMLIPFPHFGVITFDLDNFSQVNDTFGHDAGDEALKVVVDIAKTIFHRDTDIICRPGGDEFLIVMSNTNIDQAVAHAEVFRAAVANDLRLRFETFGVTVSVGVAAITLTEMSKQEEVEAAFHNAKMEADHATYHSKKNGRDVVSTHPSK
ncbi:MAG: GGDEF domain-containing protein [Candidatus Moranbacteria bacterium]|nr:GGDEF domain-containing protein [Candidatus Moranbacteria bacterium]